MQGFLPVAVKSASSRAMERLLLSGPSLTAEEVAAVACAFLFLSLVPFLMRLAEERRRRATLAVEAETAEAVASSTAPVPTVGAHAPTPASAEGEEAEWLWPTAPPLPSVDPWHPDNGPSPAETAYAERESRTPVEAPTAPEIAVEPAPAAAASEGALRSSTLGERVADAETPSGDELAAPAAQPSALATPPPEGVPPKEAVRRCVVLPPLPQADPTKKGVSLIELRRAVLPSWPPAEVLADPEKARLWQAGEELFRRFAPALLEHPLPATGSFLSFALGAVESDGQRFRLYCWLFPEPWPVLLEEATAVAWFEVDPTQGLVAAGLLPQTSSH